MSQWQRICEPGSSRIVWRLRLQLVVLEVHETQDGCFGYVRRPDEIGEVLLSTSRRENFEAARQGAVQAAMSVLLGDVEHSGVRPEVVERADLQLALQILGDENRERRLRWGRQVSAAMDLGLTFQDAATRVLAGEIFDGTDAKAGDAVCRGEE